MKTKTRKTIRDLTADEVTFTVTCEPEYESIERNCSAIDDDTDRATADWIRRELDNGNQWAWCTVKVTAAWGDFEGEDYLGCCSYRSKEDFCGSIRFAPDPTIAQPRRNQSCGASACANQSPPSLAPISIPTLA